MDQPAPFFSIITPVYNGARYLPELIKSVQAQAFTDYEHIIIDDGSTDNGATVGVLARHAEADPRLRWWTRPNRGQYATQNEALDAARGTYIVIIAADDIMAPGALQRVHAALETPADVVYGRTRRITSDGAPLPNIELTARPSRWLIKQIVYAQHCAVYVRRERLAGHGLYFDETLRYTGDWDWLIRVFAQAARLVYLRAPLAHIRLHDAQTSRQAQRTAIQAEHRVIAARYGGSYPLHVLLTRANNARAMLLIGLDVLRRQGPGALWRRVRAWLAKRFNRKPAAGSWHDASSSR